MVDKNFIGLDKPDITRFESYLPTAFSSELTLLQKVNKIIQDLNRSFDLTNEMVDYLNRFIEMFDEKLYDTLEDVLTVWIEDGRLADVVRVAISEEVIEARTDYLGHTYLNLKERLDSEKADVITQLTQKVKQLTNQTVNALFPPSGVSPLIGDGITDDTINLKELIAYCTINSITTLLIPPTSNGYLINETIIFPSNLTIKGESTRIYVKSKPSVSYVFRLDGVQNSGFKGLKFYSTSDRIKPSGRTGLSSNIYAFDVKDSSELHFENLRFEHFDHVFNFKKSSDDKYNDGVTIENIKMYHVHVGFFISYSRNFNFDTIYIDRSGSTDALDHHFYINDGVENISVNNVVLVEGAGYAVTVKEDSNITSENVSFNNIIMKDCYSGFYFSIGGGHSITNLHGRTTKLGQWFGLGSASIHISNFDLDGGGFFTISMDKGPVKLIIENGTVGKNGKHYFGLTNFEHIEVRNVTFLDATTSDSNNRLVYFPESSIYGMFIFKDNTVIWRGELTTQPISIRTDLGQSIFDNNLFLNEGVAYSALSHSPSSTTVIMTNNKYSGFSSLTSGSTVSKLFDNIDIS